MRNCILSGFLGCAGLALIGCGRPPAPAPEIQIPATLEAPSDFVALPSPTPSSTPSTPKSKWLTPEGYQLILDFEVGGGRKYYEKLLRRPTVPPGESGVTIGVGYDCRFNSKETILQDWKGMREDWLARVASTAGLNHVTSKERVKDLRDILIEWELAEDVFNSVTVPKFYALACRAYPGFEAMHPNAQASILSVVFNRGTSKKGPRRVEMRNLTPLIAKRDYLGMAALVRQMERIWIGTDLENGMIRRREAEATLLESCAR